MNRLKLHQYSEKVLLLALSLLILILLFTVVIDFSRDVRQLLFPTGTTGTIRVLLVFVANFTLASLPTYVFYVLICSVFGIDYYRTRTMDHLMRKRIVVDLLHSPAARRNRYLILGSTIGTLLCLFMYPSVTTVLYWILALFISSYFVRWQDADRSGIPTIVFFMFLLLLCTIYLNRKQNYELLERESTYLYAFGGAVILIAVWILLKVRPLRFVSGDPVHLVFIIITCAFMLMHYGNTVLSTINCYYDPMMTHTNYSATVLDKMGPYKDKYYLCVLYHRDKCPISIQVHPKTFEVSYEGSAIIMHLHPGFFGWSWYHDDIHTRY